MGRTHTSVGGYEDHLVVSEVCTCSIVGNDKVFPKDRIPKVRKGTRANCIYQDAP